MNTTPSEALIGTLVLLITVVLCGTLLVALSKLDASLFVGAILGPLVGAGAVFVTGVKASQQTAQSMTSPPPDA